MRRLRNSFLAAFCTLVGCGTVERPTSVFLDPQFAALIPPDTTVLVGTRVEQLVATPLYRARLSEGRLAIIDKFARATGIRPEKSLWNLLYVCNGRQSFVLGRGKFADELMAPDFSKPGVRRFSYKNLTMFGDEQQGMVLVNSSTIAMGETAVLRNLVDQRPSLQGLAPQLAAMLKEIPYQTQFWGVYLGGRVDIPFTGNLENVNKVLSFVHRGTFYFDLTNGIKGTLSGEAAGPGDAQQVHEALAGFLALGRGMAPKNQPELGRIFDGIEVAQEAQRITVKVNEPEDLAEKFVALWVKP